MPTRRRFDAARLAADFRVAVTDDQNLPNTPMQGAAIAATGRGRLVHPVPDAAGPQQKPARGEPGHTTAGPLIAHAEAADESVAGGDQNAPVDSPVSQAPAVNQSPPKTAKIKSAARSRDSEPLGRNDQPVEVGPAEHEVVTEAALPAQRNLVKAGTQAHAGAGEVERRRELLDRVTTGLVVEEDLAKLNMNVPKALLARIRAFEVAMFRHGHRKVVRTTLFTEAVGRLPRDPDEAYIWAQDVMGRREATAPLTTRVPQSLYLQLLDLTYASERNLPYTPLFVAAIERLLAELEPGLMELGT
ncbi:MAG: hypothetical protein M3500_13125 [Actinomycetota bacterium]|nr:hypothetical protein [Actinomycetota bacterium]